MNTRNFDTVTEAIADLTKRGYTHDFVVEEGEDCLVCHQHVLKLSPNDFRIDEVYRFEGQTDPGDEMIVYAIASDVHQKKGLIVNAFGMYADSLTSKLVEKLSLHPESKVAKVKPIKRSNALVQFSREHHFGLLLCWKIRQGLKRNITPTRISNYVLFCFEIELTEHFKEEEKDLFNALPADDKLRKQAFFEHEEIYGLIENIKSDKTDIIQLNVFADKLENHIRFEERTLFNYLQELLSAEKLAALEAHHSKRDTDFDSKWNDHFWVAQ